MNPTEGISAASFALWTAGSFIVSTLFVWIARAYARHRNLLDLPGQRRSHTQPTPRGGGIGIVIAVVLGLAIVGVTNGQLPVRLIVAVLLIALIGWIDDHRPLSAALRLIVQLVATLFLLWVPLVGSEGTPFAIGALIAVAILVFFYLWSINLHNFMDGINGILSMQVIFVFTVLSALCVADTDHIHALLIAMWAAAVLGFLPFNFPKARIFMGDVGSGTLGLLVAVAAMWQFATPGAVAVSGLIAMSAFMTDASCTLVSRMLGGKRWYSAHREHLYQWMTRAGQSHAQVVGWYAAWNLLIALPLIVWLNRSPSDRAGYIALGGIYAVGVLVWIFGKRWCLSRVKSPHANA